ncbi:unnamed protein product [Polarella glacialis]|uniref:Myosin motor domain-containing protein n=1 Tax=Polarella glacialis TaxID=89957 RepID=A0A813H7R6_POLGL|nr:unnamed protein product [Polarella glacialis]
MAAKKKKEKKKKFADIAPEGKSEFVWYPAGDGEGAKQEWLLCQLLGRNPGDGARVKPLKKDPVNVRPEDAHLICPRPDQEKATQNLAGLGRDGLGPEDVEDAVRNHFYNQLPYTNINDITLCVNPFRELNIYSESWIEKYSALDPSLRTHI